MKGDLDRWDDEPRSANRDPLRRAISSRANSHSIPPLPKGFQIADRYEIEGLVPSQGGSPSAQGQVYVATDRRTHGKKVAIKVHAGKEELQELLCKEGMLLARLDDPRIVKIHEAGSLEDGRHFLVMDYIVGSHLDVYCDEARLDVDAIVRLVVEVCRGLVAAHTHPERKIYHHDIKPSNLLVARKNGEPLITIVDFGLAHMAFEAGQLPPSYMGRGTSGYAAPELRQTHGEFVNFRNGPSPDVYSIGAMLYDLLSGCRLVTAEHPHQHPREDVWHRMPRELRARAEEQRGDRPSTIPDESTRRSDAKLAALEGDLGWIIAKACRFDPRARYATVAELQADLECYLKRLPVSARKEAGQATWAYRARLFAHRKRTLLTAAAVALVILAGSTSWLGNEARKAHSLRKEETSRREQAEIEAAQQQRLVARQKALNLQSQGERMLIDGNWRAGSRAHAQAWLAYPDDDATRDGLLRVAMDRITQGARVAPIPFILGRQLSHHAARFNHRGDRVCLLGFGEFQLFDVATGEPLGRQTDSRDKWDTDSIRFTPDDSTLIAVGGGSGSENLNQVVLWDARTGEVNSVREFGERARFVGNTASEREYYFLAITGREAAGQRVELWELHGNRRIAELNLPPGVGLSGLPPRLSEDERTIVCEGIPARGPVVHRRSDTNSQPPPPPTRQHWSWAWRVSDGLVIDQNSSPADDDWAPHIYKTHYDRHLTRRLELARIPTHDIREPWRARARLWDLQTSRPVGEPWGHDGELTRDMDGCFDWEGCSALTVGGNDQLVRVEAMAGKQRSSIRLPERVWHHVFPGDGDRMVCWPHTLSLNNLEYIVDLKSGEGEFSSLGMRRQPAKDRRLSGRMSERFTVWANRQEFASLAKPDGVGHEPYFAPDGGAVGITHGGGLMLWSLLEQSPSPDFDFLLGWRAARPGSSMPFFGLGGPHRTTLYGDQPRNEPSEESRVVFAPDGTCALWAFSKLGVALRVDLALNPVPIPRSRESLDISPTTDANSVFASTGFENDEAEGIREWHYSDRIARDPVTFKVLHRRPNTEGLSPIRSEIASPLKRFQRQLAHDDDGNVHLVNAHTLASIRKLPLKVNVARNLGFPESLDPTRLIVSPDGRLLVGVIEKQRASETSATATGNPSGQEEPSFAIACHQSEDGREVARIPLDTSDNRNPSGIEILQSNTRLLVKFDDGDWQLWDLPAVKMLTSRQALEKLPATRTKSDSVIEEVIEESNPVENGEDSDVTRSPLVAGDRHSFVVFRSINRFTRKPELSSTAKGANHSVPERVAENTGTPITQLRAIDAETGKPQGPWIDAPTRDMTWASVSHLGDRLTCLDQETVEDRLVVHRLDLRTARNESSAPLIVDEEGVAHSIVAWGCDDDAKRLTLVVELWDRDYQLRVINLETMNWHTPPRKARLPSVNQIRPEVFLEFVDNDSKVVVGIGGAPWECWWAVDTLTPIDPFGRPVGESEQLDVADQIPANARRRAFREENTGNNRSLDALAWPTLKTSRGVIEPITGSVLQEWTRRGRWSEQLESPQRHGLSCPPPQGEARDTLMQLIAGIELTPAREGGIASDDALDAESVREDWDKLRSHPDGRAWLAAQRQYWNDRSWFRSRCLADRRLEACDWTAALFHLDQALAKDPQDADSHWDRALCLAIQWRWEEARKAFHVALRLMRRDPNNHEDVAWLALANGDVASCHEWLRQWKQRYPDRADEVRMLEGVLQGQPRSWMTPPSTADAFRRYVPESEAARALVAAGEGDWETTREMIDRARIVMARQQPVVGRRWDMPPWWSRVADEHALRQAERRWLIHLTNPP